MNIFVIMPFSTNFHLIFAYLIKSPLQEKGHTVERSLESNHQHGLRAIIQGISNADLIIADLTKQNANVTYELGIAHTLKKPTLQIAQSLDDVRYDLRPYNVILYSISSDGTSGLADDILSYIEREPGNEYNFSNPVSDFTDSDQNNPIKIRAANVLDDGRQLSLLHENELDALDGIEYGVLDANADVERAGAMITSTLQGLTSDMNEIGERTRAHTHKINELSSNPGEKRIQSKALRIMKMFAADVKNYSQKVKEKSPILKEAWMTLEQAMEYVLITSDIENQSDVEAVQNLLRQSAEMQKNLPNAIASIEDFRDSHEKLIGISKVSNTALRNSVKELDRLIDELKLGDSVVTRISDLAIDKLERYNESMPQ
ncbi:MAG: hypothetical protein OXT68_14490 [Chloroflexota bacterium]|nr:hypothetical protein [Chloroflexota bacterium]